MTIRESIDAASLGVKLAVLGIVLAIVSGAFFWPRITSWYWKGEAKEARAEAEQAKADTKVARKDEAQANRSADITAATVQAQDTTTAATRAATTKGREVIRERIRQNPAPPADPAAQPVVPDRIVWNAAEAATFRAQGAENRLRRAQGDGPGAEPAP